MTLIEQLYRVARRLPCTCWNNSRFEKGKRVILEKCGRCKAVERYEAEHGSA